MSGAIKKDITNMLFFLQYVVKLKKQDFSRACPPGSYMREGKTNVHVTCLINDVDIVMCALNNQFGAAS